MAPVNKIVHNLSKWCYFYLSLYGIFQIKKLIIIITKQSSVGPSTHKRAASPGICKEYFLTCLVTDKLLKRLQMKVLSSGN